MPAFGNIVIVTGLLDPQGRNPKDRPCVVVTPPVEAGEGETIDVVAITTLLPDPLPPDHVPLPWHAQDHPRTGLNKRNAAVCSWFAEVSSSRVARVLRPSAGEGDGPNRLDPRSTIRRRRGVSRAAARRLPAQTDLRFPHKIKCKGPLVAHF